MEEQSRPEPEAGSVHLQEDARAISIAALNYDRHFHFI
jgi:hypothetical protein